MGLDPLAHVDFVSGQHKRRKELKKEQKVTLLIASLSCVFKYTQTPATSVGEIDCFLKAIWTVPSFWKMEVDQKRGMGKRGWIWVQK